MADPTGSGAAPGGGPDGPASLVTLIEPDDISLSGKVSPPYSPATYYITTEYDAYGLHFGYGHPDAARPVAIFDDSSAYAWAGTNGDSEVDLFSDVDVQLVMPASGGQPAFTNEIIVEMGWAADGAMTLTAYDCNGQVITTQTNGPATGPNGRTTANIAAQGISSFKIETNNDNFGVPSIELDSLDSCGQDSDLATFHVSKVFNDGNPAAVDVTLSCNTGLPIEQTRSIDSSEAVAFLVKDFTTGTLNCTVTEDVPMGYSVTYYDGTPADDECSFSSVTTGSNQTCVIHNEIDPVEIEVTKIWHDDNPSFEFNNSIRVTLDCEDDYQHMRIHGNPGEGSFYTYPHWDGEECDVDEDGDRPGVISDDSDCQDLMIAPGVGAECTIENTRLYEGIPTLSQYGLALLALLMLAVGTVGFRRFV